MQDVGAFIRKSWRWTVAPFVEIGQALRPYCRIDRDILCLAAVFSLLFGGKETGGEAPASTRNR